jgi:hypothetical protein
MRQAQLLRSANPPASAATSLPAETVSFYLPGERDLGRLEQLDLERDWSEFVIGERAWVLQTYLRLRRAGRPVELVARPPRRGMVVFYARHGPLLVRHLWGSSGPALVGVRGDHREVFTADFEVVQNGVYVDRARRFYVPLWSQPGLTPRDPARGARIERVAFKGFRANLHPALLETEWRQALAGRGIEWIADTVEYRGQATAEQQLHWQDFRAVDLIVALRPENGDGHTSKPATKLYNAWKAGVPAVLGPEPSFRELRQSELDFIEAATPAEALQAIDRLRADPALYLAMVSRGAERCGEFDDASILSRWSELLWGILPPLAERRSWRRLPLWARALVHRMSRILARRPAS